MESRATRLARQARPGDAHRVMATVPLMSARGLVKSFGGRRILDGTDLELSDGARIGVLGPNGGGKSPLRRTLAGQEPPDAGEVTSRRGLVVGFLPQEVA